MAWLAPFIIVLLISTVAADSGEGSLMRSIKKSNEVGACGGGCRFESYDEEFCDDAACPCNLGSGFCEPAEPGQCHGPCEADDSCDTDACPCSTASGFCLPTFDDDDVSSP